LQDPLLRKAHKKRRPLPLPIYGPESKYVDMGVEKHESDLAVDDDESEFVGDYFIPKDKDIDDRIAARYLSLYRRGDRSIDTVYGIRREDSGTFMLGDKTLSVDENGDVAVLGVTYEGK
jgi:hypothetical protein